MLICSFIIIGLAHRQGPITRQMPVAYVILVGHLQAGPRPHATSELREVDVQQTGVLRCGHHRRAVAAPERGQRVRRGSALVPPGPDAELLGQWLLHRPDIQDGPYQAVLGAAEAGRKNRAEIGPVFFKL